MYLLLVYLTLFEVYMYVCVFVCTRKGSALISVRRAKEVIMRAEANTVFGACIRNEYMYIRACVAKINIKSK